ncbi:MAG TPA: thioesterase family protein [Candidatus Binatia bacterium]|nr:thioesterase family protein [Candidatus Binatia bacterium]
MTRSVLRHRVPFYETDAMAIVHHANYVRYLELARIAWMDEHDRPYREYVAQGLHFSTTRVELDYLRAAAFDDVLEIATWLEWVRGASLAMAYDIRRGDDRIAAARTEHAMVDDAGRPRRIPAERRDNLVRLAAVDSPPPRAARAAR